jgi:hypothetical protein
VQPKVAGSYHMPEPLATCRQAFRRPGEPSRPAKQPWACERSKPTLRASSLALALIRLRCASRSASLRWCLSPYRAAAAAAAGLPAAPSSRLRAACAAARSLRRATFSSSCARRRRSARAWRASAAARASWGDFLCALRSGRREKRGEGRFGY